MASTIYRSIYNSLNDYDLKQHILIVTSVGQFYKIITTQNDVNSDIILDKTVV